MGSVYGQWEDLLVQVRDDVMGCLRRYDSEARRKGGDGLYEHLGARIKSDASMRAKCRQHGLPETPESALRVIKDAVGVRVVCRFVDDVYVLANHLRSEPGITIVTEKDYIRHAKPNGYRSYHLILMVEEPFVDVSGAMPGHFATELQLRTIAQDMWAALEHELRYKKDIGDVTANTSLIADELRRVADELASCDVSMQTMRTLIRGGRT